MSLWSVNDEASSRIMEEFYRQLARGKDKDFSLQKAKLQYLNSVEGREAHPYFWAAHVVIGDRSRLGSKGPGMAWLLIVVALAGGTAVAGLAWRKRKSRKAQA